MQRRDLIKVTAGAVVAAKVASGQEHRFFTPDEFATLDELTEMIIPADEKSGGARAAKVAEYIDARVAEAFDSAERDRWRSGLNSIDALSKEVNGVPFLKAEPTRRIAILSRIAAAEKNPTEPAEHFFVALKSLTITGYYTSKIGIHDDLDYKGNVYQTGDYAGELP
jgi:gluconate 2-dehydrogenase gamma chain